MVKTPDDLLGNAGSTPAIPLQHLDIRPCTSLGDVRDFVEAHHYSHSIQGITPFLSFEVVEKEYRQVGAAIFGIPGQVQTERKYGGYSGTKRLYRPQFVTVELRRFVLLDEVPRNGESYLLAKIFKRLAILGVDRIISYSDPNQIRPDHPDGKHTGMIYRATGFHKIQEAGRTKAFIMLRDFTMDGKTFKAGRRLPIRNWDQYQNFRTPKQPNESPEQTIGGILDRLPLQVRIDWEKAKRNNRAVIWEDRAGGKWVLVIKTPEYLTSLSKRLRTASETGAAEKVAEAGKILYIKDLKIGMPYFGSPQRGENNGNIDIRSTQEKGVAERKTEKTETE